MFDRLKKAIRKTKIYKVWLYVKHPEYLRHLKNEKIFYRNLIEKDSLVYDIGANVGNKTALFRNLGYKVVGVEPDNFNFNLLLKRFKTKPVTLLNFAISNTNGESVFYVEEPGSAFNTLSQKWKTALETPETNRWKGKKQFYDKTVLVKTVTLDHLIENYGMPYFIKIDVEGNELNVLKGLSRPISVISFEANLPEFKDETISCIEHLFSLDNKVVFDYIVNDESFELKRPISFYQMIDLINHTERRYLEIFSFMDI